MNPTEIYADRIRQAVASGNIVRKPIPGREGSLVPDNNILTNITDFRRQATVDSILKENEFKYRGDVLKGQITETLLSQSFFSSKNIQMIQNGIRKGVYDASNGTFIIDNQSELNLLIIMRSIFFQEAKHLPDFIPEQVLELNRKVISECIPRIMTNVKQYNQYLIDRSVPMMPLEQPRNVSVKGTKTYDLTSLNQLY